MSSDAPSLRESPDAYAKAQRYAKARAGAAWVLLGPHFATARGVWLPRLAAHFVRLDDAHGYPTRAAALDAARRYRALCREAIAAAGEQSQGRRVTSNLAVPIPAGKETEG